MTTILLPEFVTRPARRPQVAGAATPLAPASSERGTPRYRVRYAQGPAGGQNRSLLPASSSRPAAVTAHGEDLTLVSLDGQGCPPLPARRSLPVASVEGSSGGLTRRGRFVFRGLPLLVLTALVVFATLGLLLPDAAQGAGEESGGSGSTLVRVYQGDSLWSIAQKTAPQADTRDVVHAIMELNDLDGGKLVPGQELRVPVYTAK